MTWQDQPIIQKNGCSLIFTWYQVRNADDSSSWVWDGCQGFTATLQHCGIRIGKTLPWLAKVPKRSTFVWEKKKKFLGSKVSVKLDITSKLKHFEYFFQCVFTFQLQILQKEFLTFIKIIIDLCIKSLLIPFKRPVLGANRIKWNGVMEKRKDSQK